ncbi:MAG: hypothetical protein HC845_10545 [Akkermansiaceae bacterium]|nr:hypothetical protein [Akkermansiaceae bacterium]
MIQLPDDAPFTAEQRAWLGQFLSSTLGDGNQSTTSPAISEGAESEGFSKANPFPASVVQNYNLNGPGDKETHHVALSLDGSGLEYEVGDALGVFPVNPPHVVDEILANLPFGSDVVSAPDSGEISLRDALIHHYDIGTLNKSIIQNGRRKVIRQCCVL